MAKQMQGNFRTFSHYKCCTLFNSLTRWCPPSWTVTPKSAKKHQAEGLQLAEASFRDNKTIQHWKMIPLSSIRLIRHQVHCQMNTAAQIQRNVYMSANVTHFSTSTCWQLAQVARKLGTSWNPVAAQHPLFLRQVNCSRCPSCPWCPVHCRIFEPVSICFHVQQSHSMLFHAVQCCPMLFHFSETKAEVKCERLRCRCFLTELVRAVQVNVLSCDAIEKQKGTPAENCRSSTHVMKCNGSPSSSPTQTSPNSPRRQCFAS